MIPEDVIATLAHMNVLTLQESSAKSGKLPDEADTSAPAGDRLVSIMAQSHPVTNSKTSLQLNKKLAKKAQGCTLVDRKALKRWLFEHERRTSAGSDIHVDRDAFLGEILFREPIPKYDPVEEDQEDEEMES